MALPSLLFLCGANSCRSQMAEGFLRHYGGDRWQSLSAGVRCKGVHPLAIKVMAEAGVDISRHESKTIQQALGSQVPDVVVGVCSAADALCPIIPGVKLRLSWPFDDPDAVKGDDATVLREFRRIRDEIRARIEEFLNNESKDLESSLNKG